MLDAAAFCCHPANAAASVLATVAALQICSSTEAVVSNITIQYKIILFISQKQKKHGNSSGTAIWSLFGDSASAMLGRMQVHSADLFL